MKDKKSIAIVVLAAITAGVGIYSIVNNKSKLDAFTQLETEHKKVTGKHTKLTKELQAVKADRNALDTETRQLKNDLGVSEESVQTLTKEKDALKENITANNQKYVDELGKKADELALKNEDLKKAVDDLVGKAAEIDKASKELADANAELEKREEAFTELKTKTDEIIGEGKKMITDLEAKNDALNQAKGALENKIEGLDEKIAETNKKLEASEGDRTFLERELLRLQDEKAELVRKINDIEFIAAQYKRIKSDINIARRLEWMRRGIGHYAKNKTITEKYADLRRPNNGGTLAGVGEPLPEKIQVELTSDGEVKINGKVVDTKEAEETPEQPEADNPIAPIPPVPTPLSDQD